MSNLAPDLGLFGRHPIQYQMFDPHNPPVFYKKGGKIVKAQPGSNTINWDWMEEGDYNETLKEM